MYRPQHDRGDMSKSPVRWKSLTTMCVVAAMISTSASAQSVRGEAQRQQDAPAYVPDNARDAAVHDCSVEGRRNGATGIGNPPRSLPTVTARPRATSRRNTQTGRAKPQSGTKVVRQRPSAAGANLAEYHPNSVLQRLAACVQAPQRMRTAMKTAG
jgi:hypothetical protein